MGNEKIFSEDEAMHLVSREVAKQRMGDMERLISNNESKAAISFAELKLQIGQVITMIEKQNINYEKANKELKEEIEKDFVSKIDFNRLENKVDKAHLRITVTISTVIAVGLFAVWIVNFFSSATKLVGH